MEIMRLEREDERESEMWGEVGTAGSWGRVIIYIYMKEQ